MRTYGEAEAAAREGSPFSNGTEGYASTSQWCDRCVHDQSVRRDDVKPDPRNNGLLGCALLGVALMGKTPSEWMEQDRFSLGDQYHCIEFRDEDDPGPGYGPQPDPPLPGQLDLFPGADFTGTRMFVQPSEVSVDG